MTIQVQNHNTSKAALKAALAATPQAVQFHDPGVFTSSKGGWFTGADIPPGDSFPVVLDPATRRRFAKVTRKADGSWRVD